MIKERFKEVCFLLAGSLIGIIAGVYQDKFSQYFWLIAITTIALILLGMGLLEWLKNLYTMQIRKINTKKKLIYIYAPYEIDSDNSSWVNLSCNQIFQILKSKKIPYKTGQREYLFSKYPLVLNPYGGAYPESNVEALQSIDLIFDYVRNGGIYVNIADIPFYYAFDKNLGRKLDTTPFTETSLYTNQINRNFINTIVMKKLQCRVFGIDPTDKNNFDKSVARVIGLPSESSKNLYMKKSVLIYDCKYSPVVAISYGKGYFVFSTIQITEDNRNSLAELIKKSFELL